MMLRGPVRRSWKPGALAGTVLLLVGGPAASSSAQVVPDPPAVVGQWSAPFEEGGSGVPRCTTGSDGRIWCKPTAVSAAVLRDGRILYFNGVESSENIRENGVFGFAPESRDSRARVLDLRHGSPEFVTPTPEAGGAGDPDIRPGRNSMDDPVGVAGVPGRPGDGLVGSTWGRLGGPETAPTSPPDDPQDNDGDMFCSDLVTLEDGRVLIAGGTDWYNQPAVMERDRGDPADVGIAEIQGVRSARLFDPGTNSFTPAAPMKYARWYPGLVVLPDGKVLVASGVTRVVKDTQASQVRRTETYDPETDTWTENHTGEASENSLPQVPRLHLMPNGKVFFAGVGQLWGPFGQAADEVLYALEQSFDPATKQWEVAGLVPLGARSSASQVMLALAPPYWEATLLTFGGTLGPPPGGYVATPLATLITVDAAGRVTNRMTGSLHHPRWYPSGVLLPDGTVLAVGGADRDSVIDPGSEIPVRTPELYDPGTGRWVALAEHARDRAYHNSALLLPDARVLLGGHSPAPAHYGGANRDSGPPFANNDKDPSFEIFSPPYLFRGPRPTIARAQAGIRWGERFPIGTPQAGSIESVVLMQAPSPTHVTDSDQRMLRLEFAPGGTDRLEALAPPNGVVAPPGHYYLFVLRASPRGPIPSVARLVRLGEGGDERESIQPFPDEAAPPTGGSATPAEDTSSLADARRDAPRPSS